MFLLRQHSLEKLHIRIKNIPGVIGFLGAKKANRVPLRQAEVNRILGKVDELSEKEEEMNILLSLVKP